MFCRTHLYLPKHPWVENYNYNQYPADQKLMQYVCCYESTQSPFQFNFGLAEGKQELGCLPHRSSSTRRVPCAGTHLCNTHKRQEEEEEAAASLPHQCHHSTGPWHRPAHTHALISTRALGPYFQSLVGTRKKILI